MLDRTRRPYVTVTAAPSGVVEFRMGHALFLARAMRDDEIEQYEALCRPFDPEEAALDFCNRAGPKFTLVDALGLPIIAGGYTPSAFENCWDSWMLGTMAGWETHWRAITKASRWLGDELLASGARRLQTLCLASRSRTIEWYIRSLRMTPEGIAVGLGRGGEDVARFVRMKEADHGLAA
jgi:hypothetical protein